MRYLQPADGDVFLIAEAEADDVEHDDKEGGGAEEKGSDGVES